MIRFKGLVAPTEVPTGDGRMFAAGKATNRPMPLPVMAQFGSGGHAGAIPVAKMEKLYPGPGGYWAEGYFLDPSFVPEVPKAVYMLQEKVMGPSVDLDRDYMVRQIPHPSRPDKKCAMFDEYNIIGTTLVPMPAFSQVYLSVESEPEKVLLASAGVDLTQLLDKETFDRVEDHPDWIISFSTSEFEVNEADCGCTSAETESDVQGIIPNGNGVEMPKMSATAVTTTAASTFIVDGVRQPSSVTFNFGDLMPMYHGQPFLQPMPEAPAPPMEETPAAVVKVYDDKTVVKLPDEGIKVKVINEGMAEGDGPGCYFNEDGICPVCGY